jgi:hypothetical protein
VSRRKQKKAMAAWTQQARETSPDAARALVLSIVRGESPGFQAYDLGIVLNDGETVWQRAPAHYQYRGERSWVEQHNSRRGYRSTINEVHQPCMFSAGFLDWLITDQRLGARQPDGTVLSIYWSAIEAITVDLARECVVFDAADGYHGVLSGAAIAPIAVAAIASCHGAHALLDHPALEPLRTHPAAANPSHYQLRIENVTAETASVRM